MNTHKKTLIFTYATILGLGIILLGVGFYFAPQIRHAIDNIFPEPVKQEEPKADPAPKPKEWPCEKPDCKG